MALGWLKSGTAAEQELQRAKQIDEQRSKDNVFRFWMPDESTTRITFLDGKIYKSGKLAYHTYWEHNLHLNGSWRNWFICTSQVDKDTPCPICEGDHSPALVSPFTVIDHSEYKDKKGKLHKDEVRLFVCKKNTLALLQKLAVQRKGLAGCTFEVSRVGDNAPNVGSVFDFIEKQPLAVVLKKYKLDGPLDYNKVIKYRSPEELRKLGFGGSVLGATQYNTEEGEEEKEAYEDDYADNL